jgi:threonine synthase
MHYISTRGSAPEAGFEDVLLAGLAPDGGLYMPVGWPSLRRLPSGAADYAAAAASVIAPYTADDISEPELFNIAQAAYRDFDRPDIAPLTEIGPDVFLLELFHGPTLAFKDFAMQLLSRLMARALERRGATTTIVGATSGDTGAAAVEAFRGRPNIELFILFPNGRVSDVQRKQMTTVAEANIHAIAVDGTFDDAQTIVKTLFGDAEFRARFALSAINSINWARIAAQAVYYYTACARLGQDVTPSFSVPTGNFGDVFAGYVAARMGLSIGRLIIATNENDILARTLATGFYEPRDVQPTDSPSMDIQISSNFERLLFEETDRDADFVVHAMHRLKEKGSFELPPETLRRIRDRFSAYKVSREEAARAMRSLYEASGTIVDPHTAVGLAAAHKENGRAAGPIVVLGTAHAAKFPQAVKRAIGCEADVPERLRSCLGKPERFEILPNSPSAIADYIRKHASDGAILRQ